MLPPRQNGKENIFRMVNYLQHKKITNVLIIILILVYIRYFSFFENSGYTIELMILSIPIVIGASHISDVDIASRPRTMFFTLIFIALLVLEVLDMGKFSLITIFLLILLVIVNQFSVHHGKFHSLSFGFAASLVFIVIHPYLAIISLMGFISHIIVGDKIILKLSKK